MCGLHIYNRTAKRVIIAYKGISPVLADQHDVVEWYHLIAITGEGFIGMVLFGRRFWSLPLPIYPTKASFGRPLHGDRPVTQKQ